MWRSEMWPSKRIFLLGKVLLLMDLGCSFSSSDNNEKDKSCTFRFIHSWSVLDIKPSVCCLDTTLSFLFLYQDETIRTYRTGPPHFDELKEWKSCYKNRRWSRLTSSRACTLQDTNKGKVPDSKSLYTKNKGDGVYSGRRWLCVWKEDLRKIPTWQNPT